VFEIETQVTIALGSGIFSLHSKSYSLEAMRRGGAAAERPYQSREKACGVGEGRGFGLRLSGFGADWGFGVRALGTSLVYRLHIIFHGLGVWAEARLPEPEA